jgi:hypothetical protein
MNNTLPCQYLSYTYNQEELHDFALYCMKKYDQAYNDKLIKYPWVHLTDQSDRLKLKTILKELHDMFESIGQPLEYKNAKMFYLDSHATGAIHKDPGVGGGNNKFNFSKWAVNIPAVNSDQVDIEFFDNISDETHVFDHGNQPSQSGCLPKFYKKYFEQYEAHPFEIGSLPEEQKIPYYKKSFTKTTILDPTIWHRSHSHVSGISIRFQYMAYWDLQKSYAETVDQLKSLNNIL